MRTVVFALIICLFLACSDECVNRAGMVGISFSEIPDTISISENAEIKIQAEANNGCWSNLYVELENTKELEYSIKAYGHYESCGICPDVMVYKDTIINFHPSELGEYTFRISELPDKEIIKTMIVK